MKISNNHINKIKQYSSPINTYLMMIKQLFLCLVKSRIILHQKSLAKFGIIAATHAYHNKKGKGKIQQARNILALPVLLFKRKYYTCIGKRATPFFVIFFAIYSRSQVIISFYDIDIEQYPCKKCFV